MARVWIGVVVIVLLCAFTFTIVHGADKLVSAADGDDEFENEEFETRPASGIPLNIGKQPPSKSLQQDDEIYDEDEFEGFEHVKPIKEEEPAETTTPLDDETKMPPPRPRFGALEITYITFISIFLANYFLGKKANERVATSWGSNFQQLLTSYFNKFGDSDRFTITKESAYSFSVSASGGRAKCAGAVFTLDLSRRHDLTAYATGIFNPHKDTLTVDVAMHPSQPFCFGLAKKKEEKQLLKNYKDVAELGQSTRVPQRLSNYVVYTDSTEIVDDILTREAIEILANNEQYFSSVGYNDRSQQYLQYKTILRIVYRLPPVKDMKKMQDLMRLVFILIDSFASVQLTKTTLAKNDAMRKKSAANQEKSEHDMRQELAQKKKQDRLQAERAAYEKLSPEAQRKFDEKEEKRKLKAKQAKVKVVYS